MQLKMLLDNIASVFPFNAAMPGDRIGLQIEADSNNVTGVLFTLEVTEGVINECKSYNFNTIITFHPLIYSKLATISLDERVGKLCSLLIKNSINLISVHTAFDAHINGTSTILANLLDLDVVSFLVPNNLIVNSGMGVIATPRSFLTTGDLVSKISTLCGCPVRYCGMADADVKRVAIVGGSGMSFVESVRLAGCDCFITADVTYHDFHAAQNHFTLIDVGHYEMEQFVPKAMCDMMHNVLNQYNVEHATSQVLTNPITYWPDDGYLKIQNRNL